MMIRSFLPVGQGAFYCEQFEGWGDNEDVNIVYDCGSSTNVKLVEKQIRDNFYKDQTIHAVFISHLDDDHINGIPFLLKYCHVKKMFFPLITEKNTKYISLLNIIKNNGEESFASLFVRDPYEAFNQFDIADRPKLYKVEENDQSGNNEIDAMLIRSGENVIERILENVIYNSSLEREWLFIPYNFRQEDRLEFLQNELENCFGKDMDSADLQSIWENGTDTERNKIKDCYKKVKGSFNTNSMTLYSGMEAQVAIQYVGHGVNDTCHAKRYCCCDSKMAGCLYMGDYDASGKYKWKELYEAYDTYWENIGCIQIPHHGSKHNYNSKLAQLDAFYVMSAGARNRYHHPHSIVIKDLLFNGHFPYIVTEYKCSELHLVVDI